MTLKLTGTVSTEGATLGSEDSYRLFSTRTVEVAGKSAAEIVDELTNPPREMKP